MDDELLDSFKELCSKPPQNEEESELILNLLSEIIVSEVEHDIYKLCYMFVNSSSFKYDINSSRRLMLKWLKEADVLETNFLIFIGAVLATDLQKAHLHSQRDVLEILINVVWVYRHTELSLVQIYLLILYEYFSHAQINTELLDCVSVQFVEYLYYLVCSDSDTIDAELIRQATMVLVALNDQFMLHDLRGDANPVFHVLESNSMKYVRLGPILVQYFNRCSELDLNLKIFFAKFFYLMFSSSETSDLLYTNDLGVLGQVLLRELNDLPVDQVDVRAMYLRLLYVLVKNSPISSTNEGIKPHILETLRMTIANAHDLDEQDRLEIQRLTERCMRLPWLSAGCKQAPPPPPPPRRHNMSSTSLDKIEKVRPPPPPPSRRSYRSE